MVNKSWPPLFIPNKLFITEKMNKAIIALAFLWMMSGLTLTAKSVNKENLKISFEIGNLKFRTVEGSFDALGGEVHFDSIAPETSSFDLCIDASSVNTGNDRRDKNLRDEEYFHVEKFPSICFQSLSVAQTGEGYVTRGQLTMMGVTLEVDIPFIFGNGELSGELNISRYDYNLAPEVKTGKVSEEVKIFINYS